MRPVVEEMERFREEMLKLYDPRTWTINGQDEREVKMTQSNTKEQFTTGAQRDTHAGKCRPDLISPYANERVGEVNRKGAEHYGDRNWEKGMPFSRVMASLERHLMAFKQGRTDEDHLAQMVWNGQALLHYEAMIKRGLMDPALNDLPNYEQLPRIYNLKELHDLRTEAATAVPQDSAWQSKGGNPEAHDYGSIAHIGAGLSERAIVLSDEQQRMVAVLADLGCKRDVAITIAAGTKFYRNGGNEPTSRRFVYIAGPMRGYDSFNFPAFDMARNHFLHFGSNVISPADIDRAAGDENEDDQCKFALRDFYALLFMRSLSADNAVVFLEGWEKSTGARAEFAIASWLGLQRLTQSGKKLSSFNGPALLDSILAGLPPVC